MTFTGLLPHTVTIEPRIGTTGTGEPIYGPPVQVRARVDPSERMVRTSRGDEVLAVATVFIGPGHGIEVESRVTFDGDSYEVVEVKDQYDATSLHHQELALGPKPRRR